MGTGAFEYSVQQITDISEFLGIFFSSYSRIDETKTVIEEIMYRNTWLEINLDEIEENIRRIKQIAGKRLIAVVKANAYGTGDSWVSKAAVHAGADMLAVSSLDEAMILRNQGYTGELLILGHVNPSDLNLVIQQKIAVPAYAKDWVNAALKQDIRNLKVHLKVDTGMNRIGFKDQEEAKLALEALIQAGCQVEGIFTHFCCSDTDPVFTQRQFDLFKATVEYLNYPFEWIHCDNSDATVYFKDSLSNACRLGVSMYGVSSYLTDLKHPISLYSRLFLIKKVSKGETIGYGATYTADRDIYVATMPIGYADGFVRANQGRKVYVDGRECEVIGRVCMDQSMILLDQPTVENDLVEIFGKHISIERMAEELHTIPYEILCLLQDRMTRVYIKDGKVIETYNERLNGSFQKKTGE